MEDLEGCRYAGHTPQSAYRLGCRCSRCLSHKDRINRALGNVYPRERVAQTMRHWMHVTGDTLDQLANATNVRERTLYRVLHGPSPWELENGRGTGEFVNEATVDRLLCGIGWLHLFHLPPEDGGYADLYYDGLEENDDGVDR